MTDRSAFAVGAIALAVAGVAMWLHYGVVDWRTVGILVPSVLVGIGVGMLLLSRKHN